MDEPVINGFDYGVWARRQPIHSTPDSSHTMCDGCQNFECIVQDRSKLHPYRFYCDKLGRELPYKELFRMTEDDCPVEREKKMKGE